MKNLIILLIPFMVNSQILTLDVDVMFSNEVKNKYDVEKFEKKLNKDYFSNWNLNVNLIYRGELSVESSKERKYTRYLPNTETYKNIVIVIVPESHIRLRTPKFTMKGYRMSIDTPAGYARRGGDAAVINSKHFNTSVVAHELCHLFTLKHLGKNNTGLMSAHGYYFQPKGTIFQLLESQIKLIRRDIKERNSFKNVHEYINSKKSVFCVKKI